ncbi:hypothetical protein GCM10023116_25140 [Kistimonas scapharcae]|uniref:Uncharacterized protein n=2 Tax=Kistimonas scapharcae TaxID=1036133 RepID=A0ABP8V2R3_9GAMM
MCEQSRDYFSSNAKFEGIQFRRRVAEIVSEFNDFIKKELGPKINELVLKRPAQGGGAESSEKEDVVPDADSKEKPGFSVCLSEEESAALFPEWSLFSHEKLFLKSVTEFSEMMSQSVDDLQNLLYKSIFIQVLKKARQDPAQREVNIAYQVRCDLEDDGIESAFDSGIKQFDQRFEATVMATNYDKTPQDLGSRFSCLNNHVFRYINYLMKVELYECVERFNTLLECFGAIDQQDVGYFMGSAVTAYLNGGEDYLRWGMGILDIKDFKKEVDDEGDDYDMVLVEEITKRFSHAQRICRFFSNVSHEKSVFLSNLSLYSQEFNEDVSRVTISSFMRDVVKKEHGCYRLSDPDCVCAEPLGASYQKKLFCSGLIQAIRLSVEENEPVQAFVFLMLSHGYDDFLDMISGFVEFCERQG